MKIYYYQQAGDAKMPYLAQYSTVCEELPVNVSSTIMKNNIAIKKMLNPLKAIFNMFLIVFFFLFIFSTNVIIDNEHNLNFYIFIIVHFPKREFQNQITFY
jgi:hypothetical protein